MSINKKTRDDRRRQELKARRNKGGRPPGDTALRNHGRRFETALWLCFVRWFRAPPTYAARYVLLIMHTRGATSLQDVGRNYVSFSVTYIPNHDERCHDMVREARKLQKRAEKFPEDHDWLERSALSLAVALLASSNGLEARIAIEHLQLLGWRDVLQKLAVRIDTIPNEIFPGTLEASASFARRFQRRGLSFGKNLAAKSNN